MLLSILAKFPINGELISIKPFGDGLINSTFLITTKFDRFILQKINLNVFKKPEIIANNLRLATDFLIKKAPDYLFTKPIRTIDNKPYAIINDDYWRLTKFIENSYSTNVIEHPNEAYEAAKAFGALTRNLNGVPTRDFSATIPDFHNLSFRFLQFQNAIEEATPERKTKAQELVENFLSQQHIVTTYEDLVQHPEMPVRIMHHDTKINNVLFDKTTRKAVAVCDLDTLMPGRSISDIGDMYRTYLCPVSEESTDYEHITIRKSIYEAIRSGYLSELGNVLTTTEKKYLDYGGEFMIFMQGIRFLADYLDGDNYYPVKHSEHNLNRATNQWILLRAFQDFPK